VSASRHVGAEPDRVTVPRVARYRHTRGTVDHDGPRFGSVQIAALLIGPVPG